MSTTIRSLTDRPVVIGHDDEDVSLEFADIDEARYIPIPVLLDAVRAELNVIIIDKADLPEVERRDEVVALVDGIPYPAGVRESAEEYRAVARRALAVAEYLDANPPVDEAQVEALAGLIGFRVDEGMTVRDACRHAIATGRIEVRS